MEMRGGRPPGIPAETNHLASGYGRARCHQNARKVAVHCLVILRMLEKDKKAILRVLAGLSHRCTPGCTNQASNRDGDIDSGMRFVPAASLDLPTSDVSGLVQRPSARQSQTADGI